MRCSFFVCVFTCIWSTIAHGDTGATRDHLIKTYEKDIRAVLTGQHALYLDTDYLNRTYCKNTTQILNKYVELLRRQRRPGQIFDAREAARQILNINYSPGGLLIAIFAALHGEKFGDCVPELCYLARALFENAPLIAVTVPKEEFRAHLWNVATRDTVSTEQPFQPQPISLQQLLAPANGTDYCCLFDCLSLIANNNVLIPFLLRHPHIQDGQNAEFIQTAPFETARLRIPSAQVQVSLVIKNGRQIKLSILKEFLRFWSCSPSKQTPLVALPSCNLDVLSHAFDALRLRDQHGQSLEQIPANIVFAGDAAYARCLQLDSADPLWLESKWVLLRLPGDLEYRSVQECRNVKATYPYPWIIDMTYYQGIVYLTTEPLVITGFGTVDGTRDKDLTPLERESAIERLTAIITNLTKKIPSGQLTVVIACHARSKDWRLLLQQLTAALKCSCPRDFSRLALRCIATDDCTSAQPEDGTWADGFKVIVPHQDEVRVVCGGGGTLHLRVVRPHT
jgi:hypothetical protein